MALTLKDEFESKGYVRVDGAIAPDLLEDVRRRMNEAWGSREPRSTIKLGDDAESAPLISGPRLRAAYDALIGPGRWIEPAVLEDLRIKLPGHHPVWWHVDVFERGPETRDDAPLTWRASRRSGGVGLLVLLLLSDVGPTDGATAIRVGSHRAVAKRLEAVGDDGLALGELLDSGIATETAEAPIVLAAGPAGTAFLCHPLLVHTALAHTGVAPSYWALPAIRVLANAPK